MSYALAAVHCQILPTFSGGGGTQCDPFTKPTPTAIYTTLQFVPSPVTPAAIDTHLCAPVS